MSTASRFVEVKSRKMNLTGKVRDFSQGGNKMGLLINLLVGALIGWLGSLVMGLKTSLIPAIVIGIVGSFLANWLFGSVLNLGGSVAGGFSFMGLVWGIVGAALLIWILRLAKVLN